VTRTLYRRAIGRGQRPIDVDCLFGGKNTGAAANTNSGSSGIDRRLTGVAQLTADNTHSSLGERYRHVAAAVRRVVDKFVDHDVAVGCDGERTAIEKQELNGACRRRLDTFLVHDMGADLQDDGRPAGRRGSALG